MSHSLHHFPSFTLSFSLGAVELKIRNFNQASFSLHISAHSSSSDYFPSPISALYLPVYSSKIRHGELSAPPCSLLVRPASESDSQVHRLFGSEHSESSHPSSLSPHLSTTQETPLQIKQTPRPLQCLVVRNSSGFSPSSSDTLPWIRA